MEPKTFQSHRELAIGMKVRIIQSSEHYDQCLDKRGKPTPGIVTRVRDISLTEWIGVKWENGHSNEYRYHHLYLEDIATNEEALVLLKPI